MNLHFNKTSFILLFLLLFVLTLGFLFIENRFRAPSKPHFTIQEFTYATDIEGVRYFNRNDEFNLILKYNFLPWEWAPKPEGFELSPQDADFIYSSVLRNALHFGETASHIIYYDADSYYLSENQVEKGMTITTLQESTVQVSGHDGRVFNRASNAWENVGYIHLTYPEVVENATIAKTRAQVIELFGHAFESTTPALRYVTHESSPLPVTLEIPDNTETLEYLCRDGNFIVLLVNGHLVSVTTNLTHKRL